MVTTKKKKNQDRQNLEDILTALAIGFIAMTAYKDASLGAETLSDIASAMIPTILLIGLIFAGLLILTRRRIRLSRAESRQETIGSISLEWGKALKHDLITYLVPVLILIIPPFLNQKVIFNDFLQAIFVFSASAYLKFMYWGKFF